MDEIILNLDKREVTGKQVKQLRAEGMVPAVIHDHGKPSLIVMGPYLEMMKAYKKAGKHAPVNVQADGKHYTALIKTAEFDPQRHELTHVVFNAVKANENVQAEVPVKMVFDEGNDAAPAERNGLIVLQQLETIEIEAFPKNLPDALVLNGEKLVAVGDQATVADLVIPTGVTVKADPTQTLFTVFEPSALQASNDAAGGSDDAAETAAEGEASAETPADDKTEQKETKQA